MDLRMTNYSTPQAVADRIYQRINKSAKLQKWAERAGDMSVARMATRIATTVNNFNNISRYLNEMSLGGSEGLYPLDFSCRNYDNERKAGDFAEAGATSPNGAGTSAAEGTRGVDVVDLTLIATVESMIPTMAVDFGMAKPTDLITYQKLIAVNEKGEVAAGADVVNPYKPLNFRTRSSQADTTITYSKTDDPNPFPAGTYTDQSPLILTFAPIAPGSVTFVLADNVVGEDVKADGNIYFMGASAISATVDYVAGTVTIIGTVAADDIDSVTVHVDMGAEDDGSHTLKLVPKRVNWTVTAVQHAVQLQNNIESISYIDKQILGKNFGEVATRQMLDAFIYTLNDEVVRKTIDLSRTGGEYFPGIKDSELVQAGAFLDLSLYYSGVATVTSPFQNFSTTKNEMIKNYLNKLGSAMLENSDRKFTYILCGTKAAEVFMLLDEFKPVMAHNEHLDSVIGYLQFAGRIIAVARHQEMKAVDDAVEAAAGSGTWASFVLGYRDPEGAAAPVGYFEYLPICSSKVALNYQNSLQFSQSVFNYSTAGKLIEQYIYRGAFKLA